MPGRALMRAGVWRLRLAALAAALLAGCAGTAPVPALAVSSVAPAGAYGSFVVDGTGFFQYPSGRGMRVEACGVTVDAELVDAETTEATLPPAGLVTIEVAGRLAFGVPAGSASGASDVRIVRPDGQETVLEGAIVCPSDAPAVAVIDADALEGYVPFTVSFSAERSSGAGALGYEWDLGDGMTSTEPEATRTFTASGEHVVTLTVTAEDGGQDTARVTVRAKSPVLGVTVEVKDRVLRGRSAQATATVTVLDGVPDTVTWTSSDEDVLVVDQDGLVTAIGVGEAEVIATSTADPEVSGRAAVEVVALDSMSVLFVFDRALEASHDLLFYALEELEAQEGVEVRELPMPAVQEVLDALEAGPDLVVFDRRRHRIPEGVADALVEWIEGGGRLVFTTWSYVDSASNTRWDLLDALQVTRQEGSRNHLSVTVSHPTLLAGLGSDEMALENRREWSTYSLGYEHPDDREAWGEFDDGSAAIVPGNEGHTVTLGFFMDTLPLEDGVTFYENLIKLVLLHGLD